MTQPHALEWERRRADKAAVLHRPSVPPHVERVLVIAAVAATLAVVRRRSAG